MEKTNKMRNLTNDMKNFEKLMQEQRKEKQVPEIEIEIDTEEDSPADILLQAAGMLMDCSVMVAKAAFLVGLMEAETDEDDEDECENCPYSGDCGSTYGTMVLVARPDGDNTIMTMDELGRAGRGDRGYLCRTDRYLRHASDSGHRGSLLHHRGEKAPEARQQDLLQGSGRDLRHR